MGISLQLMLLHALSTVEHDAFHVVINTMHYNRVDAGYYERVLSDMSLLSAM
jgi:hypothetical protein